EDRDQRESTLQAAGEEALRLVDATNPADVEIRRSFSDDASKAICGRVHVHQITVTLCRNAMQAMAPGGGTIDVTVCQYEHDPEVRADLPLPRGRYNCLTIAHAGTAHSRLQDQTALAPDFIQSSGVAPGALGVALVHAVVSAMGGLVTTQETDAGGAEVSVYFPPHNARAAHGQRAPEPRSAPHILVVDDEPNVVQVLNLMLVRSGYVVSVAPHGAAALDIFNSAPESIDMLITDVHMPGLRGDNLARAIRRQRPDIPVLFITGHKEELRLSFMDNRETEHVLLKPFDYAQLLQGIKSAEISHPSAGASGVGGER
ncbi:MAG: response regulator, partial [Candidatus Hydrogenedentes bacterium]|nr:response regulator [Candidatus Hydrogenedentota bacterium]